MSSRHLVFVFRSAPYTGSNAQEGLAALLATAVFAPRISVIFLGDGVFQMLAQQHLTSGKSQLKMLQALSLYDVEEVYFQVSALAARNLSPADIGIPSTGLTETAIAQLLRTADQILSF